MKTFDTSLYIKKDTQKDLWAEEFESSEVTNKMLEQRGFSVDKNGNYKFNHGTFIKYALTRINAVNTAEGIYFYNYKESGYDLLIPEQYQKIFFDIIEEASDTIWKSKYESDYLNFFIRRISFETGDTYPSTPDVFSLAKLPYEYDDTADAPMFKDFLNDIFENDQERIAVIQEIMGACLYYDDIVQKLFVFLGSGANGKSLLCKIIEKMLGGKTNVSAISLERLGEGRFSKQNLDKKFLNISSETISEKLYSTSDLKALTGGDLVEIEQKYKNSFTGSIHAKFILLANEMIQTKDYSDGFYRRLLIVPFNQSYHDLPPNGEREDGVKYKDPFLEDKLLTELSGIFNFAYDGLVRLFDNDYNFTFSKACDEALNHYKNEHNVVKAFYNNAVEIHDASEKTATLKSTVYQSFVSYCKSNRFKSIPSSFKFHPMLIDILETEDCDVSVVHRKKGDYYTNLTVK